MIRRVFLLVGWLVRSVVSLVMISRKLKVQFSRNSAQLVVHHFTVIVTHERSKDHKARSKGVHSFIYF